MNNEKINIDDMLPIIGGYQKSYLPFYNTRLDYNTNASSYFDYLAQYNNILRELANHINRLMAQSLDLEDTKTIEYKNTGNHLGTIERFGDYTDNMKIRSNVKISSSPNNIIKIYNDGLYVEDSKKYIDEQLIKNKADSDFKINKIKEKDIDQDKQISSLQKYAAKNVEFSNSTTEAIQKISARITDLEKNGGSTGSGVSSGELKDLKNRVTKIENNQDTFKNILHYNKENQETMNELMKVYNKKIDDLDTKVAQLSRLTSSLSDAVLVLQQKIIN
nr:MAG TPA: tail fiber protein [Caudoviricetes sp.]